MTTIVDSQTTSAELFVGAIGPDAEVVPSIEALRHHLDECPDEFAVVLGPSVNIKAAVSLADTLRVTRPALSVILVRPRVDTSVLAEALRSGMREVVEERDLTGLSMAVRRGHNLYKALMANLAGHGDNVLGHLVTVFSAKGGVGKTTVSTNLSVALSGMGHRVCLVDLDLAFGDVAITLQMFPAHTISEALAITGDVGMDELRPLLTKYSDNLVALLAPSAPDPEETQIKNMVGTILRVLKQGFDYVIVDTPPAFDDQVLQAFDETDLLLLVLTPDVPALKNLKISLEMLELLNFPRDRWRIVLNRAGAKVGLSANDVEKTLKSTISAWIPTAQEVPASINRGEPIVVSQPRHAVSQAFLALARDCAALGPNDVLESTELVDAARADKRHLFHRRSKTA
jgi:pilus assembly protein CpaE